jgi:peptide/nickel transport system ATP-binding protein
MTERTSPAEHPEGTPPLLEVRDLKVTFAGRIGLGAGIIGRKATLSRAVDGVSLQLRQGEVLALAGESVSGKNTTARDIIGLEHPRE